MVPQRNRGGAQVSKRYARALHYVESVTEIVPLNAPLALQAGETDFIMKKRIKDWPLADSIIYAAAKSRAAKVVSGDPHFRSVEDVIFIG